VSWSRRFEEPIELPEGRKLKTLAEAIPKSEHKMEKVQTYNKNQRLRTQPEAPYLPLLALGGFITIAWVITLVWGALSLFKGLVD